MGTKRPKITIPPAKIPHTQPQRQLPRIQSIVPLTLQCVPRLYWLKVLGHSLRYGVNRVVSVLGVAVLNYFMKPTVIMEAEPQHEVGVGSVIGDCNVTDFC